MIASTDDVAVELDRDRTTRVVLGDELRDRHRSGQFHVFSIHLELHAAIVVSTRAEGSAEVASSMTVLGALDLRKAYGARSLLDGVSLTIDVGERVGVVGRNGAGKSTLARILAGDEPSDGGTIAVRRGARVAYHAQEPNVDDAATARAFVTQGLGFWLEAKSRYDRVTDAIGRGEGDTEAQLEEQASAAADVERLGGWQRDHEVERVLQHLGIEAIDDPIGTMSGGQKRRVALAKVLVDVPDLMILDEPTNHLDADSIHWLERYLIDDYRGALLIVTHDRWLLDRVADRTIEVDHGKLYAYDGGYEDYLQQKAERGALAERTESNRQNFLRTELEWLRRQPKARSTKQKARIERAEAARAAVPLAKAASVVLSADVARAGNTIVEFRGITLAYDTRPLVRDLNLALTPGERLGVLGPNGAGKTSLLKAITGELNPRAGEVILGKRTRVGYLDQARAGLDPEKTVFDSVADAIPSEDRSKTDPRNYLERFAFDGSGQRKRIAALSGGERARVALARVLAAARNLLLLDEPSNDLDTDTLSALEDFLSTYEGSLLVVTHDRYLLDRVTTGILCFEGDGRVTRYAGAYQAYAAKRAADEEERKRARASVAPTRSAPAVQAGKKALTKNEERELGTLPDKIESTEAEFAKVEAGLADASLYQTADGRARARELEAQRDTLRSALETLMHRWEELEQKKSASHSPGVT
jgi:ABC transport system ATP-binding/permease protein